MQTASFLVAPRLADRIGLLPTMVAFVLAGAIKIAYDLTLWAWFRHLPLPGGSASPAVRRPDSLASITTNQEVP